MRNWAKTLRFAIVSGTFANMASTLALAAASWIEGKGMSQPTNATSHWFNGDRAGEFKGVDLRHTGIGPLTNQAATVFWAAFFERRVGDRQRASMAGMLRDALAMSAVAAAVDYGATPKRFTPGWELVLSKRSMAAVYVAMATGMAAGSLIARRGATRRP